MKVGRVGHSLVTLADGRVLAAGGSTGAGDEGETETNTAELWDPRLDAWLPVPDITLPDDDAIASLFPLSDGRALVIGENGTQAILDLAAGRWTAADQVDADPWTLTAIGDTLIGFSSAYYGSDDVEVPQTLTLRTDAEPRIVAHWAPLEDSAVTGFADDRVFAAGGVTEDDEGYAGVFMNTVEVFDPADGSRTALAPIPGARAVADAVSLPDGSVLVSGGVDLWETIPSQGEEEGNDTPRCVPAKYRVVRWVPSPP